MTRWARGNSRPLYRESWISGAVRSEFDRKRTCTALLTRPVSAPVAEQALGGAAAAVVAAKEAGGAKAQADDGLSILCLLRPAGSLIKRHSDPLFFAPNDMTMSLAILRSDQEVK